MSYIKLKDVNFKYNENVDVLIDINIEIEKGESVAIVGQNGAGKTTMAKLMNGLLKPTSGDVLIGEINTKEVTAAKLSKNVGYVFQNPDEQIFHNNVYKEIIFGLKRQNLSNEEIEERIQESAKLVGIEDLLDENPYDLPLSTRKFVTIASVIAMKPEIIILDEPTAGQDKKGLEILELMIKKLINQQVTILTITHDMEFVVNNFSRVIAMSQKRKIADGDTRDVFWDVETLEKGMLKQPQMSRLSSKLNFSKPILNIDEIVNYLKEHIHTKS